MFIKEKIIARMMTLDTLLQEIGLTVDQVAGVLADEWFHVRDEATLRERLRIIQETYGYTAHQIGEVITASPQFAGLDHTRVIREATEVYGAVNTERVKEAILKHPPFANYDYTRVIREATGVYGATKTERVKEVILKFPQFAGYDHTRVIREATEVYGATRTERVKEIILKWPPFSGLNHTRVIREAVEVYGTEKKERVKEVILKWPQFAGYDHTRVIREATEVYGATRTERVKEIILKYPQFAGLDHTRVLRQAAHLGRLVGLSSGQYIEKIMQNPVLAGYSAKRSLAVIDIGRSLVREGYNPEKMMEVYFGYCSLSPYLPGRKRISQAAGPEPPMMKVMRRRLRKLDGG